MRYVIWGRDDYILLGEGGRIMEMDAFNLSFDETVPVISSFNADAQLIGTMTELECVDGELTGELNFISPLFNDTNMERLNLRPAGKFSHVHTNKEHDYIEAAVLNAVAIVRIDQCPPPRKDVNDG